MARSAGTAETLVASFARPDQAKAAMAKLERTGVPTSAVRLLDAPGDATAGAVRRADERKVEWFKHRWVRGAIPGALVGAVVLAVGVSILWEGESSGAWIAAALGGLVAGAFVGGFLALGVALPRNPEAWDTYLLEHNDEVCIAVSLGEQGDTSTLPTVLLQEGATSVGRLPGTPVRRRR